MNVEAKNATTIISDIREKSDSTASPEEIRRALILYERLMRDTKEGAKEEPTAPSPS